MVSFIDDDQIPTSLDDLLASRFVTREEGHAGESELSGQEWILLRLAFLTS